MFKDIWIKVRRGIENTEVSTFLLLLVVPFFLFSILWQVFADRNNVVCEYFCYLLSLESSG